MAEPNELAEAEVIARAVSPLNPWAGVIMAEYDRRGEALAQRKDPIETALEAELGAAEEKIRQLTAALTDALAVFDVASGATVMGTEEYAAAKSRARAALAAAVDEGERT